MGNLKLIRIDIDRFNEYFLENETEIRDFSTYIAAVPDALVEYKVCRYKITQDKFNLAQAEIVLESRIDDTKDYFALQDDKDIVFAGKISKIVDLRVHYFVSHSFTEPNVNAYKFFARTGIFKGDCPVFWSCDGLKCVNPFELSSTPKHDISVDKTYKKSFAEHISGSRQKNVSVKMYWSCRPSREIDVSHEIFGVNGINTLTPKKVMQSFPSSGDRHHNFEVSRSKIEVSDEKIVADENGLYKESVLKGELVLNTYLLEKHYETWRFVYNSNLDKKLDLRCYIDWSSYISSISEWEQGKVYRKGQKALLVENGCELGVCKEEHVANESNRNEDFWEMTGCVYEVFGNGSCYNSQNGKAFAKSIAGYIALDKAINGEADAVEFKAPLKFVKNMNLGDRVRFQDRDPNMWYVVVGYVKVCEAKGKFAQITCVDFTGVQKEFVIDDELVSESGDVLYKPYCEVEVLNDAAKQLLVTDTKKPVTRISIKGLSKTYRRYVNIVCEGSE